MTGRRKPRGSYSKDTVTRLFYSQSFPPFPRTFPKHDPDVSTPSRWFLMPAAEAVRLEGDAAKGTVTPLFKIPKISQISRRHCAGVPGDGFQRYSNAAFSRPRKFRTFPRLPALAVPGAGVTRLKATVTKATVTRGARAVLRRQQNGIAKRKNARPAPPRATVPAHFRAREQSNSSRRYRMIIFSETRPRKPAYRRH